MTKQELKIALYEQLSSMKLEEMTGEEIALKNILENDEEVLKVLDV